eukprot:2405706-Pyramimonas_sp.AAC.1
MLGTGIETDPAWLYGDPPGGADSNSTKLNRVGLAVVKMNGMEAQAAVYGHLASPRQVVPRGELK